METHRLMLHLLGWAGASHDVKEKLSTSLSYFETKQQILRYSGVFYMQALQCPGCGVWEG